MPDFLRRRLSQVGSMLTLSWLAIALTRHVAPAAAGSGIPEMKSILAGNPVLTYLSSRTLLAKARRVVPPSAARALVHSASRVRACALGR